MKKFPIEFRSDSIPSPEELKFYRQQSSYRFHEWRPWLVAFWLCHFAASALVISWGGRSNQNVKYIPVNVDALNGFKAGSRYDTFNNCSKGFVNVFASSMEDPGALICCSRDNTVYPGAIENGICNSPHWLFFFTSRLARFPEAWLLPLFPFLVRLVVKMSQKDTFATAHAGNFGTGSSFVRRRFYLYIAIIQFRGWILYLLFDKIEEYLVTSEGTNCWYESLLHHDYSSCQGQVTDFSDHLVLYFSQILPIPLMEVLHSFVAPFWRTSISPAAAIGVGGNSSTVPFRMSPAVPTILLVGLFYLYVVTFIGAYKTSVYFHTWPEIVQGYLISLLVQVPMFLIQCTTHLDSVREYFFGFAL
jgi:hypothetical protein